MAKAFYRGISTYLIHAEDSAFGTAGTPAGSGYVDKVTSFTGNINNNMIRVQGIGEGRNATSVVNGNLDCTGNLAWELTDPAFLQYCFIGVKSGAGTVGDPYEIAEADEIGYAAGQVNTITFEVGSKDSVQDDVMTYDGIAINNWTLNATQGATIKCTGDWIGRTGTSGVSSETYVPPTNRPLAFLDGQLEVDSDIAGELVSLSLTGANNLFIYRGMGNRLISQPIAGIRRYDFTVVMKFHHDDTASVLSGLEARGIVFTGVTSGTTPTLGGANTAVALSFNLIEGAGSGDRVINFDFEECYFNNYSRVVAFDAGVIEVTLTGFALAGLTDGSDKVPCRWWTIA